MKIDNPKSKGVVDKSLKLLGIKNVYVASPAVFPCVGFANPTLMNMSLAIYLANKLESDLQNDKGRHRNFPQGFNCGAFCKHLSC